MKTLPSHSEKYKATIEVRQFDGTSVGTIDRIVTPAKHSPYMTHTCIINGGRRPVHEPHGASYVLWGSYLPLPKDLDTRGYN